MVKLFCAIVGAAGSAFEVDIDEGASVSALKDAIKVKKPNKLKDIDAGDLQLFLAKTADGAWLESDSDDVKKLKKGEKTVPVKALTSEEKELRGESGLQKVLKDMQKPSTDQIHVLVVVPEQNNLSLRSPAMVPAAKPMQIPSTIFLNEPDKYAEECTSLAEWTINAVHEIPLIWKFMSSLGGCTNNGKIFWRLEDKQVASILVDGWFRESTDGNINVHTNKKSILMGSPGIGKSTLLCVMAFYLVFKYKKNVLVYRRLTKFEQENCLFYLGYEDGKVVQFAVQRCKAPNAINIYEELIRQQGISNVWLLLDGFRYQDIPEGVRTFKMLATSQQVNLKSQERVDAYCCLLPCWSKKDLWLVGNLVYSFSIEDTEERFYYSGGSVREFTLATLEDVRSAIDDAISGVDDISNLLSNNSSVLAGTSQVDRLRHTFVKDADDTNHFTARRYWEQVIDSEYAVLTLSVRLRSDALFRIYAWARSAGHGSLAGSVFEVYIHRLAADNMLRLHISEYDPPTYRKPGEPRGYEFKPLLLKTGTPVQWGTSSEYKPYLEEWRDNDELAYWFPACDNFPNIDSIAKLESGGVAYLHVTVAEKHATSNAQLKEMNAIFGLADTAKPPIYIAICPDRKSCQDFVLTSRTETLLARKTCQVFVGYFEEYQLASPADGPKNNISVKPVPPEHTHNTRKRQRTSPMC